MKKLLEITLGIVTSVGGFLEIGSIVTAAQGGADFGYQLAWAIALGTLCLVFLVEMAGRMAAVSGHTIVDAMRERFGIRFFVVPLVAITLVSLMVLVAELGGVCVALQLATGVAFRWWALPVALVVWALLWRGTFGLIEKGVSVLGLVTVAFAVGAARLHPSYAELAAGLVPSAPSHDGAHYWFLVVSILGASISPYLFFFYSSGGVEDEWDEGHIGVNRAVAVLGMTFGGFLSMAVLVVAARVFQPRGITVDHFAQLPLLLVGPIPHWGFRLVALSLGIACLGAALEITLALAYMIAQGFGWNWGEDLRPKDDARFSLTYTGVVLLAALPVLGGIDPLAVTNVSMALTSAVLPFAVVPFLVLMNDPRYLGEHVNHWLGNTVVTAIIAMAFVLAVVSIPLELFGG